MRTSKKAVCTAQLEPGNWKQDLNRFLHHYKATLCSTTSMTPSELLNGRKLITEMLFVPKSLYAKKRVAFSVDCLKQKDECMKQCIKESL